MKNIALHSLFLIFFLSNCKNYTNYKKVKENINDSTSSNIIDSSLIINRVSPCKKDNYIPDIRINNIKLKDQTSVFENFGKLEGYLKEEGELPHAYFLNSNKTEKIKVVLFYGSGNDELYQFKLEYSDKNDNHKILKDSTFITESGIKLGITEKELIYIKGSNYIKNNNTIEYKISNFKTSCFLREYNLPEYFAYFTFKDNHLITIEFGFTYP